MRHEFVLSSPDWYFVSQFEGKGCRGVRSHPGQVIGCIVGNKFP